MILSQENHSTRHQNMIIPINKSGVEKMKIKQQKKNRKKVLHRKVNQEKARDIAVEILNILLQNAPNLHKLQKINGNSKQQHKMYVLSHRRLNLNLETKNTIS